MTGVVRKSASETIQRLTLKIHDRSSSPNRDMLDYAAVIKKNVNHDIQLLIQQHLVPNGMIGNRDVIQTFGLPRIIDTSTCKCGIGNDMAWLSKFLDKIYLWHPNHSQRGPFPITRRFIGSPCTKANNQTNKCHQRNTDNNFCNHARDLRSFGFI